MGKRPFLDLKEIVSFSTGSQPVVLLRGEKCTQDLHALFILVFIPCEGTGFLQAEAELGVQQDRCITPWLGVQIDRIFVRETEDPHSLEA